MAGSIQGLTIIINGDATPLSKAMRQLRAEASTLRTHMTAVNKLIKFDPGSTALLTRQQQLLNAQMRQTAAQLGVLRRANEEYAARSASLTAAERRQWQAVQRNLTQAELQYAQLTAQAIEYGAAANVSTLAAAGSLKQMNATLARVSGGFLAAGAAAGILTALSVKSAYDFEQSFAGVRKTIIATDEEYQKLARSTRDIALVKPIDVNDVNEIMMYAGQLGIANEYLTKFASTMADLDVATDMDLEEGSMQLARFTNIVGMSQGDVDRLGATIVDLGNNSATTESQIMLMSMRIAGAGANLGMTASDVLGLGATLSSLGIQAEMGGNAIATIMNRIDKDVALNKASLSTWAATAGMSAEEFKAAWTSDVTGTLLKVISGMGTFRDEGNNLNVLLKDMGISYMRQIDTMQRLSRAGDLATSLIGRASTAWENNTALVREATQRYDTAASKTQMMKNAFNELGITIGNEILPSFKDVVLGVTGAVQAFAKMDDGTKTTIVNIGGFAIAAALGVKAMQGITGAGASLITTYAQMKTRLAEATVAGMTYTDVVIAENGVLNAENLAKIANTEAEIANMRAKAASIRTYAASAAARGLETESAAMLAMAETLEADAATAEAGAHEFAFAAAIQDAQGKSVLTLANEWLTASTSKLAVAMGVTNGVMLASVAGFAAVALILAGVAKASYDLLNPMNNLTSASWLQQQAISQHEQEYKELVAAEGEHSEAAIRAKASLDAEKEAFENTSLTLGEFCDNIRAAREDQEELSRKLHEALGDAENSAGSMLNLADSIQTLSESALDNADDMTEMLAEIDALNQLVPDLNLAFNTTTGELEAQSSAWRAVVDEASRTKVAEQAVSNYNEALSEQATLQRNLDAAMQEYNNTAASYYELAAAGAIAYSDIPPAAQMAADALEDAQAAIDDNKASMRESMEVTREYASRQNALKYALQELATYTGNATDENERAAEIAERASEMFGIEVTAADVLAAREADLAKRTEEVTQNTQELAEELQDLMANNSRFADFMVDSGMSLNDLAQRMQEAGISADDLAKAIDDTADKVSNGFERIADESEISLQEYIENLQHNIQATENWGNNLDTLYNQASDSFERDFVRYVASLGPEYAGFVQQLVDDSDGFHDAARTWQESMQTGTNATLKAEGLTLDSFSRMQGGTTSSVDTMGSRVAAGFDQIKATASAAFEQMRGNVTGSADSTQSGVNAAVQSMVSGMNERVAAVLGISNQYASDIASIDRHSGSMYGWGASTGQNYADGLISRQSAILRAAADIAEGIKNIFGHSIAKEGPLHNKGKGEIGWGADTIDNYIEGMLSRGGALRAAAMSLMNPVAQVLTDTAGYADWDAATRDVSESGGASSPARRAGGAIAGGDVTHIKQEFNVTTNDPERVAQVAMTKLYHATLG